MNDEQAERNLAVLHKLKGLRDELGRAQVRTLGAASRHKSAKTDESEVEQQIFAMLATLVEGGSEMSLPFDDHQVGGPGVGPDPGAIAEILASVDGDGADLEDDDIGEDDSEPGDIEDDPGPDPMDVAEADKDFSDHLARTEQRSIE